MSPEIVGALAWFGAICWGICFWWMHRISARQNAVLHELRDQTRRIEQLSKAEHDLMREVHPKVGEIKESVAEVVAAVR